MAVAGIKDIVLGVKPLQNPLQPWTWYIALAAFVKVSALFMISIDTDLLPLTCNTVFMQSKGVVKAAPRAPLIPPLMQWINGLYVLEGFNNLVVVS